MPPDRPSDQSSTQPSTQPSNQPGADRGAVNEGNFSDTVAPLPRIVEIKRTLAGGEQRFECTVVARAGSHLTVLFVAPRAMNVHGVLLPGGTVTLGHFWSDRPYNVYHWLDQANGTTIGYYVNLSADTTFDDGRLEWRDLVVDILIDPQGKSTILDQDELPPDLPTALRAHITDVTGAVVAARGELLIELERHRAAFWPLVRIRSRTGTPG